MLTEREKEEILKKYTNMSEYDIKKHIQNGVCFYTNNENGYKAYFDECVVGLNDEDEIPDMWNALDVIGDYRVDFVS